jgi:hypothetical protein
MDFDRIQREILKGRDIEDVIDRLDWKEFEQFCGRILEEHNWKVQTTFRFKLERRYEIDVLAKKGDHVLAIDCKHWGIRPGKATQLRCAAEKQAERAGKLSKIKALDSFWKRISFHPIVVTLLQEDILKENDVWIVPVFKLNDFLLNVESYL